MCVPEAMASAKAEALRVIVGILASENRQDHRGTAYLIDGYFESAKKLGLNHDTAWGQLFGAAMHWCAEMTTIHANDHDVPAETVHRQMALHVASWVSETRGRGGF